MKHEISSKLLSALMVVCMALSMVPAGALAENAGGRDGDWDDAHSLTTTEPSTSAQVTAESSTENIVGEVFANAANEALEREVPDGETSVEDPALEEYPTEHHDRSYYEGSPRLRLLIGEDGAEAGYLVYRDSFLIFSQEQSARYTISQTDDGLTARVEPAIDPAELAGKAGIVFLRDDVGTDVILVFSEAEGQAPYLDGDTLVVPLEPTDDIALSQLFSDGSICMSETYEEGQDTATLTPAGRAAASEGVASSGGSRLRPQADFTPILNPSIKGTNWKASIDPKSLSIDKPSVSFKVDVWNLEFDLVVGIGLSFDFEVTSTGASKGREKVDVVGLDVGLDLFSLHYAAIFEAEFDEHPVHMKGNMHATLDYRWNPLFGVSIRNWKAPVNLTTFELTNPAHDANTDVKCYVGTGFEIDESFLELKINLKIFKIHIGPVASLNQLAQGGTYVEARLEKDTYDPTTFSRDTCRSLHPCAEVGHAGCYHIETYGESKFNLTAKLDLYFKKWTWNPKSDYSKTGYEAFYSSARYGTGVKEGTCPYCLFRVPVHVMAKDDTPLANMRVNEIGSSGLTGDKKQYAEAVTDDAGEAYLFLPSKNLRYWIAAAGERSGKRLSGWAQMANYVSGAFAERDVETVDIYCAQDEAITLTANVKWDVDAAQREVPSVDYDAQSTYSYGRERIQFQRRHVGVGEWENCGAAWATSKNGWTATVSNLDKYDLSDESGDVYPWEYRARVKQRLVGDLSYYFVLSEDTNEWYVKKNYYTNHFISGYVDEVGEYVPDHYNKCYVSYADSADGDDYTTTIIETPLLDITANEQWGNVAKGNIPDATYVALQQAPAFSWESLASERGVATGQVIVQRPASGETNTLSQLMDAGVLQSTDSLASIQDVPLAIAQMSADNGWSTAYSVPAYRNGVKLAYRACELDETAVSDYLQAVFDLDAAVSVDSFGDYTSQAGTANENGTTNGWTRTATIINSDSSTTTIGGSVRWERSYSSSRSEWDDYAKPEWVKIHVYRDGTEIAESPVTIYGKDFADANNWAWTLSSMGMDVNANLSVTEEFPSDYARPPTWVPEYQGLDIFNHVINRNNDRVNLIARATFAEGVDQTTLPDSLKVTLKDASGDPGELTLERSGENGAWTVVKSKTMLSQVPDIGSYTFEAPEIPGYVRTYKEPSVSVLNNEPAYYFTVYYVPQSDVALEFACEWAGADASTVYPDKVTADVYRDDEKIGTAEMTAGAWTASLTKDGNGSGNTLTRVAADGHKYVYSVRPTSIDGFSTEVSKTDNGSDKITFTLKNTWVGEDYVNVKGTVSWDEGTYGKTDLRPSTVRLSVVNGNEEYVRTVAVPVSGDGAYEAKYLPSKDAQGNELTYSLVESHVRYYTATYSTPTYDEATRTWTCDVENTLAGRFPLTIEKKITGVAPAGGTAETYNFTVTQTNLDNGEAPYTTTAIVSGEGTAEAPILTDKDGVFFYHVKETAGTTANCTYDSSTKLVVVAKTTDDDGNPAFKSWVGEVDSSDDPSQEAVDGDASETAEERAALAAMAGGQSSTATFTNAYPGVTVEKKWDIDLEGKDRPDSVHAIVQKKEGSSWKSVELVELSADNDWKVSARVDGDTDSGAEFRVRELREATVYDTVTLANNDELIVYDEDDSDKPTGKDATTNEVVFSVGAYTSAVTGEEAAHKTKYKVDYDDGDDSDNSFTIENKAVLEIDNIKRWIGIGVDDDDMPDSAYLVLLCKPKEGALDAAGSIASAAGVDISSVLDYEFPVINPVKGGENPVQIISDLTIGVDLGIFNKILDKALPTLAIGKVTKGEDWKLSYTVAKYTAGIPMDYKGAELGSEIIRQIIKYLTGFDLPVSYNPFQNYISIPTKAIRTVMGITDLDLSGLGEKALAKAKSLTADDIKDFGPSTLLDDWHLMANVINVKVDWNTDDDEDDPEPGDDVIVVKKVWDDSDNRDGLRPDAITVRLLANGEEVASAETSAAGRWKCSFGDRPAKDDDGNAISYSITEDAIDGYTTTVKGSASAGYTLTNTHTAATSSLTVTKTWDDADDQDGIRPDSVTVHLLADGATAQTVQLSAKYAWRHTFTGLPQNRDGGKKIVYTVTEDAVDGYTATIDGTNIVNKHTPATTSVSGTKTWDDADDQDGIRPSYLFVHLYANGAHAATTTVTAQGGWTWTFDDLPKYKNGSEIRYMVRESTPEGYTATVNGYDITNTHEPETIDIAVRKVWDDGHDQDGIRPDSVGIALRASGGLVGRRTLDPSNGWSCTFTGLPKYEGGQEISYVLREDTVEGYSTYVSGTASTGFTLINVHEPETISVSGTKVWNDSDDNAGKRPESIKVNLHANGTLVDSQTVTAANDWKWAFLDVPKYEAGKEIAYTLTETPVEGYTYEVSGSAAEGFTVKNSYNPEKTQVNVLKAWLDDGDGDKLRPDELTVYLLKDEAGGTNYTYAGETLTLSEENGWIGSFVRLDKYAGTTEIAYSVSEDVPDGYEGASGGVPDGYAATVTSGEEIAEGLKNAFFITNRHDIAPVDIKGTKVWDDDGDRDGLRPESVRVWLVWDGTPVTYKDVTADDGWAFTFDDFPKYHNGQAITYSLYEEPVGGYTSAISGSVGDGFTITNTHEPETKQLSLYLFWEDDDDAEGLRPESVTVNLLANGEDAGRSATLSEENDWMTAVKDLPKRSAGKLITYSGRATTPNGYVSEIWDFPDDDDDFVVFINSHDIETVDVSGQKTWSGDDASLRPQSIRVWLHADGVKTAFRDVTADDDWAWSFEGFPKYSNGNEIVYTISEDVVEDYTATTSVPEATGTDGATTKMTADIANAYTPGKTQVNVFKVWYDDHDAAGVRPASVTMRLLADGVDTGQSLVLSADNAWTGSFTDLDAKTEADESIEYTVSEDDVDDYATTIHGDATEGFTVYNEYGPETKYTLTYDLNGGAYGGSTDDIVETYAAGTVVSIHEAPERDGYTFRYWKGSKFSPGDSYTVTADHTFTAQWKKTPASDDDPDPDPDPDSNPDPDPDPGPTPPGGKTITSNPPSTIAKTGDVLFPVVAGLLALAVCSLGVALFARRRDVKDGGRRNRGRS